MEYFKIADKYYKLATHYKYRTPPWIKLQTNLLEDYDFSTLSDQEKYHFIASMLLAIRSDNKIVYDSAWVSRKINSNEKINLDKLRAGKFIIKINELGEEIKDDSEMLAKSYQNASLERKCSIERKKEKQEKEKKRVYKKHAIEILDFLNEKSGRKYLPTDSNLKFIMMRLQELIKFKSLENAIQDCKMIIVRKRRDWEGDEKMHVYLRPATLFNKTKFSQYQGELVCKH